MSVGHPLLDHVMIYVAQYLIFLAFAVLAVLLVSQVRRGRWTAMVLPTVVTLIVGYLLGLLAAALHPEQRPFTTHPNIHLLVSHPAGASFPSDHATAAFTVALAVGIFRSVRWGVLLGLGALLIGYARVFDGLHYPGGHRRWPSGRHRCRRGGDRWVFLHRVATAALRAATAHRGEQFASAGRLRPAKSLKADRRWAAPLRAAGHRRGAAGRRGWRRRQGAGAGRISSAGVTALTMGTTRTEGAFPPAGYPSSLEDS